MLRVKKKQNLKVGIVLFLVIPAIYFGLLRIPQSLFSYHYEFKNFKVYSDREIPKEIDIVLVDVLKRISKSELYEPTEKYAIFICNSGWRLALFTRDPNVGGLVNQGLSKNVFIREAFINENRIVSPIKGKEIALPLERPLSYFIAHEITHSLQTKVDRFMMFTTPEYIVEGYADYIGKSIDFNYQEYFELFIKQDKIMNPSTGLYNKYHLIIAYLMDKKGMTFKEIVQSKMELEKVENELKAKYNTGL
jgi:hypothetical protein